MTVKIMSGINGYGKLLTDEDISKNIHRNFVGGLWEELGSLQFEYLKKNGLKPEHKLLDLGCGCLRGGVKFIDYLNIGNYIGIDINTSLLKAAEIELESSSLAYKNPQLLHSECFGLDKEIGTVDFAISLSLFTHLPTSYVQQALQCVKSKLTESGIYFATFFIVDDFNCLFSPATQHPVGVITHAHKDPFHFNVDLIEFISVQVGLKCSYLGDWGHPRNQKMFKFEHA